MTRQEFEQHAADFVLDKIGDDDTICEALHNIPDEKEYCARYCRNMRRKCAIRYIMNYPLNIARL